jgi:protein TonB
VERIKPQLTYALNPVFPLGARLRGEEGDARVRVTLAASGRIEAVELLESSGFAALDRSALKAARQGRFAPARLGGRPVAGELVIRIRFRLQES